MSTNSTTPKVTILMCVYNGQRHLRQTIESMLNQTFKDFEFLIINDCSTDDSREIILSYTDRRILSVDNPTNIGLTKSLNRGLALARGEFIARQDADDISYPSRLEKQVAFMDSHPEVALLGTQARTIDENGRRVSSILWSKSTTDLGIRWQLMIDSAFVHSSVMFRRKVVWDELHGYDETFITGQDAELWSRVAAGFGVRNLPETLVDYRIHPRSMSNEEERRTDESICRGETVLVGNIRKHLSSAEVPDEWIQLYVGMYVDRALDDPSEAKCLVDGMNAILTGMLKLRSDPVAEHEFRQVIAAKLMLVAVYLLQWHWPSALRALLYAFKVEKRKALSAIQEYFDNNLRRHLRLRLAKHRRDDWGFRCNF